MFNARDYKECIKWLSAVKERSEKAKKAQSSDQWFRMFCGFQMEDNWFHVRSLLEALRVETEGRTEHGEMVTLMDGAEKNFIVVFSLIRSGSDDPMPWTLVVDGLLRFLWRSICRRMPRGEHTLLQKKIFNELALWCHGTAVNAFVVRLPHVGDRYVKGQTLMVSQIRSLTLLPVKLTIPTEEVVQDGLGIQPALRQRRLHAPTHPSDANPEQGGPPAAISGNP
jgi:hypothetical protein